MWVAGKTCVIPLTRAVLSALEMSLIIKHYTDLRQYIFFTVPLSGGVPWWTGWGKG